MEIEPVGGGALSAVAGDGGTRAMRSRRARLGLALYGCADRAGYLVLALSLAALWALVAMRLSMFHMLYDELTMREIGRFLMHLPISAGMAVVLWLFVVLPFGWLIMTAVPNLVRLVAGALLRSAGYRREAGTGDWSAAGAIPPQTEHTDRGMR